MTMTTADTAQPRTYAADLQAMPWHAALTGIRDIRGSRLAPGTRVAVLQRYDTHAGSLQCYSTVRREGLRYTLRKELRDGTPGRDLLRSNYAIKGHYIAVAAEPGTEPAAALQVMRRSSMSGAVALLALGEDRGAYLGCTRTVVSGVRGRMEQYIEVHPKYAQ